MSRASALGGREAELEARIEALKDEKAALDVEVKTAELVRDYLVGIVNRPAGEGRQGQIVVDPKPIPAVIEAIRHAGGDAYGADAAHRDQEARHRQADRGARARPRAAAQRRARRAHALHQLFGDQAPASCAPIYQVTNAGWKPLYRASLDSSTSRVELERQATIMQRTGEDWRGVSLRLSTGQPRPAHIVDPATWQLADPVAGRAKTPAERRAARGCARAAARPRAGAVAQVRDAVRDRVRGARHGRPAGGWTRGQRLACETIDRREAAHPRRAAARRRRRWSPPRRELPEGVWIPGDVQLYRDGSYIGSTFWSAQAKEKLVLPFGRDDRVQVVAKPHEEPHRYRRLARPAQRAPGRRSLHHHQPPQGAGRAAAARSLAGRGLRPDQRRGRCSSPSRSSETGKTSAAWSRGSSRSRPGRRSSSSPTTPSPIPRTLRSSACRKTAHTARRLIPT